MISLFPAPLNLSALPEKNAMWEDSSYCSVVPSKNYFFHVRQNIFYRHRIPLAETDAFAALPPLKGRFRVRSDVCGRE